MNQTLEILEMKKRENTMKKNVYNLPIGENIFVMKFVMNTSMIKSNYLITKRTVGEKKILSYVFYRHIDLETNGSAYIIVNYVMLQSMIKNKFKV